MNERNKSQDKNEGSLYSESENPAEHSEDEAKIDSFSLKLLSDQLLQTSLHHSFQAVRFLEQAEAATGCVL